MQRTFVYLLFTAMVACGGDDDGSTPADGSPPGADSAGPTGYASVTVGEHTACDLGPDGATCWGRNPFGALGTGDEEESARPAPVAGDHSFTQISAGPIHSCALDQGGAAWCWGSNSVGQGGSGDDEGPHLEPTPVAGDHSFTQISAGSDHTCALTSEGDAWCWGANGYGQLGTGEDTVGEVEPAPVAGGMSFRQISAGDGFTCAITSGGDGACWGLDAYGELGDGGEITGMTTSISRSPVPVAGGLSLTMVSTGQQSACAVAEGGDGYCWGRNDVGRLGSGGPDDSSSPVPVAGGHSFATIDAGGTHSCGLTSEGDAWCWGANNDGELGVADPADLSRSPVAVSGGLSFSEIAAADAGGSHTCAISADRDAVYCWGRNDSGQLGGGSTSAGRNDQPQPVAGQP